MSDSLQPHELQHTWPPCPSPTPAVYSDSRWLSWWCHPSIYNRGWRWIIICEFPHIWKQSSTSQKRQLCIFSSYLREPGCPLHCSEKLIIPLASMTWFSPGSSRSRLCFLFWFFLNLAPSMLTGSKIWHKAFYYPFYMHFWTTGISVIGWYQFCCSAAQSYPALWTPWTAACQASRYSWARGISIIGCCQYVRESPENYQSSAWNGQTRTRCSTALGRPRTAGIWVKHPPWAFSSRTSLFSVCSYLPELSGDAPSPGISNSRYQATFSIFPPDFLSYWGLYFHRPDALHPLLPTITSSDTTLSALPLFLTSPSLLQMLSWNSYWISPQTPNDPLFSSLSSASKTEWTKPPSATSVTPVSLAWDESPQGRPLALSCSACFLPWLPSLPTHWTASIHTSPKTSSWLFLLFRLS